MGAEWQYQVRIYLAEELASPARTHVGTSALQPLENVLAAHSATLVSQLDAFERYVADAEREGIEKYPLYRCTKDDRGPDETAEAHESLCLARLRPRGLPETGGGRARDRVAAARGWRLGRAPISA